MMVGLLGLGKSIFFFMCNLFFVFDEGSIEVYGKDISKWIIFDLWKKVGIVF